MAFKGKFKPKRPDKYIGNSSDIVYRSLKERMIMAYFDSCDNILNWSSETIVVPYYYEPDKKWHRYYVDFVAEIQTSSGDSKKFLIEYKPKTQVSPPKQSKSNHWKSKRRYLNESLTFIKNQSKWAAAKKWADDNGMTFIVISEPDVKDMKVFNAIISNKYTYG